MSAPSRDRFDRRELLLGAPPVELWPTVDPSHLPSQEQRQVQLLCQALWDLFAEADRPVAAILRQYGVHREALYRAARRCLDKHPDGGIYGFRAAMPYLRKKEYERQTLVMPVPFERVGCAGAFNQLLRDFPDLEKSIKSSVRDRNKGVKLGGQVRQPIGDIHRAFIKACRDAGITGDRYPLNTRHLAFRSLCSYIRRIVEKDFDMAVSHAGGRKSRRAPSALEHAPAATRPFEVVEFDGHKMDIRLTVRLADPFGMEQTLQLHRIWILVLLDIYTRAVIGYHIALGKEYNKDDVAAALQAALTPAAPREYIIPELLVREGGGFPSGVVPETAFACWDWFRMDGAKSHLAGDTIARLNQIVGCWSDNGPPATPNDRPYIERFFHLKQNYVLLRSIWQRVVGLGPSGEQMGQVNVRDPHRLGFGAKGAHRLAGYIAKYCGKQMDSRALDQKRYFRSKGIVLPELQYWRLPNCTCMLDAVHSAFSMIEGHSFEGLETWCNNALGIVYLATAPGIPDPVKVPF